MRRSLWILFILTLLALAWNRSIQNGPLRPGSAAHDGDGFVDGSEEEGRVISRQQRAEVRSARLRAQLPTRTSTKSGSLPGPKTWTVETLQNELAKRKSSGKGEFQHPQGDAQKALVKRPLTSEEKVWLEEAKEICSAITDQNERKGCIGQYMREKKQDAVRKAEAEKLAQNQNHPNGKVRPFHNPNGRTGQLPPGVSGVGTGLPAGKSPEEVAGADWKRTPEEWLILLLGSPDFGLVTLFISYYENSFIPASTFYTVIGKMVVDPRFEIRKLGVMALSSSPGPQSFLELVTLDQAITRGDALRTPIRNAINTYVAVDHLKYLSPVISTNQSEPAQLEALNLINSAASTFMKTPPTAPSPIERGRVSTSSLTISVKTFENLLSTVRRALDKSQSPASVTLALTQTRDLLERLIQQTTVASNP